MYDFLATLRNAALVSYKDYLNLMLANYYG